MIVVADTSPINYLLLIEEIDLLARLYGRVIIPVEVSEELRRSRAPAIVRAWIEHPPFWLEVRSPSTKQVRPSHLDAGEAAAIAIAEELGAEQLIIDEQLGRREAERRGLEIIGTLGVLLEAHQRGYVDLRSAIRRLQSTTFHVAPKVLASLLSSLEA